MLIERLAIQPAAVRLLVTSGQLLWSWLADTQTFVCNSLPSCLPYLEAGSLLGNGVVTRKWLDISICNATFLITGYAIPFPFVVLTATKVKAPAQATAQHHPSHHRLLEAPLTKEIDFLYTQYESIADDLISPQDLTDLRIIDTAANIVQSGYMQRRQAETR